MTAPPHNHFIDVMLMLIACGLLSCGREPAAPPIPDATAPAGVTFTPETRGRVTLPKVATHPDSVARAHLDRAIAAAFLADGDVDTDYDLETNGRLAVVTRRTLTGTDEYATTVLSWLHLDLTTGAAWTLVDLIPDEQALRERLRTMVLERVVTEDLDPAVLTALDAPAVRLPFRAGRAALLVVLRAAARPGGTPGPAIETRLRVPWGELEGLVRKDGAFWRSFERRSLTRRALFERAGGAVTGYVSAFAGAVNERNFPAIGRFLQKDDHPNSFYRTQEKLLRHYEKKGIRLQLDGLRVLGLRDDPGGAGEYPVRAYAMETFTIDHRGRRTARFTWEYTLEYVPEEDRFTLTDIAKWEPGDGLLRAAGGGDSAGRGDSANPSEPKPPQEPKAAGDLKRKVIRLTFDDGPNARYTPGILDALLVHGYKATFFLLSPGMKPNVALLKRMMAEGHTLALHGATHDHRRLYRSGNDDAVLDSMEEANAALERLTGQRSYLCRVPYGTARNLSPNQLRLLRSRGYRVWDWNLDSCDSCKGASAARVAAHTIAELKRRKGELVVLMHDNTHTLQALPEILEFIKANAWDVEPISPDFPGRVFIERGI